MSGSVVEIPTSPSPQTLTVTLGGIVYNLRLMYYELGGQGWTVDINDATNNPIVLGIPLIVGVNLLEQYGYLGFPGELWCNVDGDPDAVIGFNDLGSIGHFYFVTR
jgi:hypothetical protein